MKSQHKCLNTFVILTIKENQIMPEQQNIEYKQSWHDDYLKWICGFANRPAGRQVHKAA